MEIRRRHVAPRLMTLDPTPKTSRSTFLKYPKLLDILGCIHLADMSDIELFVIIMYSQKSATASIDRLHLSVELFHRTNDTGKLPPTHDSLTLHVMRNNYQVMVWINASVTCPTLPLPKESGWKLEGIGMTLDPNGTYLCVLNFSHAAVKQSVLLCVAHVEKLEK